MRVIIGETPIGTQSEQGGHAFKDSAQPISDKLVPLTPKARRRFYEPIVLVKALIEVVPGQASIKAPEPAERPTNTKGRFRKFVDKLASVCDSHKGGTTVTSFSVLQSLQNPKDILYVFGCNNILFYRLQTLYHFVTKLLQKVAKADSLDRSKRRALRKELLQDVLLFNRPRVELYGKALQGHIRDCTEACRSNMREDDVVISAGLVTLSNATSTMTLSGSSSDEYTKDCFECLVAIRKFVLLETGVYGIVKKRAREGGLLGMKSVECWAELSHYISRLIAYEDAVDVFLGMQEELPQLFQNFSVIPIPSSKLEPNPLGRKSQSASSIIGRMTNKAALLKEFRDMAEELQRFSLDDRIREQCQKKGFKPVVHSEALVADWILNNDDAAGYKFFNGWKYIGSSKPTCRLCFHYFTAHPSGICVRPTHGNLYPNWRFPDVYLSQGDDGLRKRQDTLNKMMESIRHDAFEVVDEKKKPMGKNHDSNTYSNLSLRQTETEPSVVQDDETDVGDLARMLRDDLTLEQSPTTDDSLFFASDDEGGNFSPV